MRPRLSLKISESQLRDRYRDWKDGSLNDETENEKKWVSMMRLGKRCRYRDSIETLADLWTLCVYKYAHNHINILFDQEGGLKGHSTCLYLYLRTKKPTKPSWFIDKMVKVTLLVLFGLGMSFAKLSLALAGYLLLWTSCEFDMDMSWKRMNKSWTSH